MPTLLRRAARLLLPALGGVLLLGFPAHAGPEPDRAPRRTVARALADARAIEGEVVDALARVHEATVSLLSRQSVRVRGTEAVVLGGVGSGVLVSVGGKTRVLTNYHVADSSERIDAVTSDGNVHPLRLLRFDRRVDLAVLDFVGAPPANRPAVLGRASHPLVAGTWVLATGNPFFLALDGRDVATLGVVSGVRPRSANGYVDAPVIQHDAEINPGNSGGPLWSGSGELIGINGTIATRSRSQGSGPAYTGASFSVPIGAITSFLRSVERGGPVIAQAPVDQGPPPVANPPGYLGITYRTNRGRTGRAEGAVVTGVVAQSPAASGLGGGTLRPGDVITELVTGDRTSSIRTAYDLRDALAGTVPGAFVSIRFSRGGQAYTWSGRLGDGK